MKKKPELKNQKKPEKQDVSRPRLAATELEPNDASRSSVIIFALVVFAVGFAVCSGITWFFLSPLTIILSLIVGLMAASCIRIAPQWEKVAILRFGRFHRVAGPGIYLLIPCFENAAIHIDQRVMTSTFSAETALTADLVPVDVDAVLFWMVWDSELAAFEVKNYPKAVLLSAQTALRDALGQTNLAELSMRRKQLDNELKKTLSEKCESWGITVISVEIRNIMVPYELQDALSKEAQASRERDARMIIAEAERDISELFVEASAAYVGNPQALQLRAMNLAHESSKDGKGILFMPSPMASSFDLNKLLGME